MWLRRRIAEAAAVIRDFDDDGRRQHPWVRKKAAVLASAFSDDDDADQEEEETAERPMRLAWFQRGLTLRCTRGYTVLVAEDGAVAERIHGQKRREWWNALVVGVGSITNLYFPLGDVCQLVVQLGPGCELELDLPPAEAFPPGLDVIFEGDNIELVEM